MMINLKRIIFKIFPEMYVILVSGDIIGYLQRPGTNLLCPATIVTNLSGHNRTHMKPYDWVWEKYMPISGKNTNESRTLS